MKFIILIAAFIAVGIDAEQKPLPDEGSDAKGVFYQKMNERHRHGAPCGVCTEMVQTLNAQFVEMSDESVKIQLNGVCKSLSFSRGTCSKVINTYFDQLRRLVAKQLNPTLCRNIEACPDKSLTYGQNVTDPNVEGILCDGCHMVFTILRQIVSSIKKDELKADLETFCSVSLMFKNTCKSLVETYFDFIYQMLSSDIGSGVCAVLGICSDDQYNQYAVEEDVEGNLCQTCKRYVPIVKELFEIMPKNTLQTYGKQICNAVPSLKKICLTFVNENFDDIYNFVVHNLDANFCFSGGICHHQEMNLLGTTPNSE